jgi:hypothetical protein
VAQVDTYYSIRPSDRRVHHNNDKCTDGKSIESYAKSIGTENRPLCEECAQLNMAEPLVLEKVASPRRGLFAWFQAK